MVARREMDRRTPDSRHILYEEEHFLGHDTDLYSVALNGGDRHPISVAPWNEYQPVTKPGT